MLNPISSSAMLGRTSTSLPGTSTAQREESSPLQGTTNKKRAMRRFEEELKKLNDQSARSNNEPAASSSISPVQKSPNSSDQLGENEQYAKALLIAVREEIYKKGYKSSNKLRATPLGKDKNQWKKEEGERISKAEDEMSNIRMQLSFRVPRFLARLKCISSAIEAKGHNCSDLSHAGIGILDDAGIKDAHIVGFSALDHDIILIGRIPPSGLPLDMEKWPSHLAICDPWANIACPAKAFISAFMEKMQKWEGNGKKIFDAANGVWSSPVYPDLEEELRDHRKVRAPYGDKEFKDEDGCTPLMRTVYAGNVDDVQLLLKAGANIETTDITGMTPLLVATCEGNIKVLGALIEAGANLEAKDDEGRTALMVAVDKGNTEAIGVLLKAGADITAQDTEGKTAKEYATELAIARDDKKLLALIESSQPRKNKRMRTQEAHDSPGHE